MTAATASGTRSYFETHALNVQRNLQPVAFGRTGWLVSPVGFGGYRVDLSADDADREHALALEQALLSGCNLIDTSANYADGGSERLVGETLRRLISSGRLRREQVVLVSKAGYVQGSNLELARERERSGQPFAEMVRYSEDCWHCISPGFLEEQLTRSLERLGVERLDVLLLHNPEYFLKTSPAGSADPAEYYRRIGEAFRHLETEASRGRIQYYGISSNTFPEPRESPEYTSLETVCEIAQAIPGSRFAVIQFPFNLFEPGALFEPNNTGGKTVAELASARGIATLTNRPLNAFHEGRKLIRLADVPNAGDPQMAEFRLTEAISDASRLEAAYPQAARERVPVATIAWGHILRKSLHELAPDQQGWRQTLAFGIRPRLQGALEALADGDSPEEFRRWAQAYEPAAEKLFARMTEFVRAMAGWHAQQLKRILDESCPALVETPTLSRKALRLYRSFPGIDCVLVGMRRREYVRDVMELDPPLTPEQGLEAFEKFQDRIQ